MEREEQLANSRAAAENLGLPEVHLDRLQGIAATFDRLRRQGVYSGWGQPPESAGPIGIYLTCTAATLAHWKEAGYEVHSYGVASQRNGSKLWFAEIRPPAVNGQGV